MKQILFVLFIVILGLCFGNVLIDQRLIEKMDYALSGIGLYPPRYSDHVRYLSGNPKAESGVVPKNQLNKIKDFGIPTEIVTKFRGMKFAQEFLVDAFETHIQIGETARLTQYTGAAYLQGTNVVFAVISSEVSGTLVEKTTPITEKHCTKKLFRKEECITKVIYIRRGLTDEEKSIVIRALKARATEEIKIAFSLYGEENKYSLNALMEPLDLSDKQRFATMMQNNEQIFILPNTIDKYGLTDKGEAPYHLRFNHQNDLVLLDRDFRPIWDTANATNGIDFMLFENERVYADDNETFLLMQPDGVLAIYRINGESNTLLWNIKADLEGPYTLIVDAAGPKIVGSNGEDAVIDMPADLNEINELNLLDS